MVEAKGGIFLRTGGHVYGSRVPVHHSSHRFGYSRKRRLTLPDALASFRTIMVAYPVEHARIAMRKRTVTARIEEGRLKAVGRYLKTRRPSETVRAAVDFIAEKAAHEAVIRKYSGVGGPDAFRDS